MKGDVFLRCQIEIDLPITFDWSGYDLGYIIYNFILMGLSVVKS